MLKTKMLAMAVTGVILTGSTTTDVFARDLVSNTRTVTETTATIGKQGEGKLKELLENGHTVEGLREAKVSLDEKGLTLDEAKLNFEAKFNEFATSNGFTTEEAKLRMEEFKASGRSIEMIKAIKASLEEKGIDLEQAKDNFANMLEELAQAGGMTPEEAKEKIREIKENGKTLEGVKAIKDKFNTDNKDAK